MAHVERLALKQPQILRALGQSELIPAAWSGKRHSGETGGGRCALRHRPLQRHRTERRVIYERARYGDNPLYFVFHSGGSLQLGLLPEDPLHLRAASRQSLWPNGSQRHYPEPCSCAMRESAASFRDGRAGNQRTIRMVGHSQWKPEATDTPPYETRRLPALACPERHGDSAEKSYASSPLSFRLAPWQWSQQLTRELVPRTTA